MTTTEGPTRDSFLSSAFFVLTADFRIGRGGLALKTLIVNRIQELARTCLTGRTALESIRLTRPTKERLIAQANMSPLDGTNFQTFFNGIDRSETLQHELRKIGRDSPSNCSHFVKLVIDKSFNQRL